MRRIGGHTTHAAQCGTVFGVRGVRDECGCSKVYTMSTVAGGGDEYLYLRYLACISDT